MPTTLTAPPPAATTVANSDKPKRERKKSPIVLYTKEPESGVLLPFDGATGLTFASEGEVRKFMSDTGYVGSLQMIRDAGTITRKEVAKAVFE